MVIVLSFFGTNYRYVHYTKSYSGFFFFWQHIGIQDMMAAKNKNQSHAVIVKVVHCKL